MSNLREQRLGELIALTRTEGPKESGLVLMVGEPARLQFLKKHFPEQSSVFFVEFSDLSREILLGIHPEVVVCPAICGPFDCLDLAALLSEAGFKGVFRVLSHSLPRPNIVAREMRQNFPNLNFGLIAGSPVVAEKLH